MRFTTMDRGWTKTNDCTRAWHACWALPGAIVTIVLMILAFAGPFTVEEKAGAKAPLGAAAGSREPAKPVLAAATGD